MTYRKSRNNPYVPPKSLEEHIVSRLSMLRDDVSLPQEYSVIENAQEAEAVAFPKNKNPRQVRVFIVWDNPVDNFPLQEVLQRMRETGAALVQKVEAIS